MSAFDPTTVAHLGLGEGGTALARGFAEQSGWRTPGSNRTQIAIDIAAGEGRGARRWRNARPR